MASTVNQKSTYCIFCLTGIAVAFNVASIAAIIPSVARDLAISEFVAGTIIWAYMIPYGICALFYGPLSRIFSMKRILVACMSSLALFSVLSGYAQTFVSLFVFRLMVGIFASAMTPLTLLYIAQTFDVNERGKIVGTFFSITFISSLIGLFLSGIIHWRWIFHIPALIGAVTVILLVKVFPALTLKAEGPKSRYIQALMTPKILRIFIYIFSISFLYHLASQWMGVYFSRARALPQFVISMLLTVVSFAGIFGEFFGGKLADAKGRVFTLTVGGLLMAASILVLLLGANVVVLAAVLFVWGLGWTVNHAACSTYLTDLPKPYLQEVSSLNSSVRFLAGGVGALFGGLLMQQSFTVTFVMVGITLFLLSASSIFLLKT